LFFFSISKSDQSDNDDGIVYGTNRKASPPPYNRNNTDYRSTINSTKLPNLDLNKTKTKTSGHETYDEDDDDIRSRPNISRSIYDNNDHNQSNLTSTSGFNKKKKVIGATGNDVSIKKSNSNEPKSFRSSYEPFPEEAPWSSSTIKTTKPDDNISKFYTKPLLTNDSTKRTMSPLVHDTKPYNSSSITKRSNRSDDDDDDFNQKQKLKVKDFIKQIEYFIFLNLSQYLYQQINHHQLLKNQHQVFMVLTLMRMI
jgi:hypothetical protein